MNDLYNSLFYFKKHEIISCKNSLYITIIVRKKHAPSISKEEKNSNKRKIYNFENFY